EALARNAARLLDELRRVAHEVALQYLKHAARMLQRFIAMRLIEVLRFAAAIFSVTAAVLAHAGLIAFALLRCARVAPRLRVVLFLLRFPSREQAAEVFGV